MKKFTDLVKENESSKEYKWTATINVEGTVTAASEGDAGHQIDQQLETVEGYVSHQIDNIDGINQPVVENKINEDSGALTLILVDKNSKKYRAISYQGFPWADAIEKIKGIVEGSGDETFIIYSVPNAHVQSELNVLIDNNYTEATNQLIKIELI